jgi:hypothetical protein
LTIRNITVNNLSGGTGSVLQTSIFRPSTTLLIKDSLFSYINSSAGIFSLDTANNPYVRIDNSTFTEVVCSGDGGIVNMMVPEKRRDASEI